MKKKIKHFNVFTFLGKRGGVIIKKRFRLLDDDRIELNGGEPIPMANFKGRWLLTHNKNITKAEAKKLICESLFM